MNFGIIILLTCMIISSSSLFMSNEARYTGSGCVPIETEHGWLLIYHGAEETDKGLVYSACAAALMDLNNPLKEIAHANTK